MPWSLSSALFWAAGHALRLLLIATAFGWLGMACYATAAVLPFAGGGMLPVALFRATPTPADRDRALYASPFRRRSRVPPRP